MLGGVHQDLFHMLQGTLQLLPTFWDLHMLGEPLRPALSNVGLVWALLLALLTRTSTGGAALGGL